jgi:ArsR family transcriptional regulator
VAVRLEALADPMRIGLMSLLITNTGGAVCTCDLADALGLTESTVSHHLERLRKAGMMVPERRA